MPKNLLTAEDMTLMQAQLALVESQRKLGVKCTLKLGLSFGTEATIYHMGAANSTVRVDFKFGGANE